jgi:hypothetical protein
MIFNKIFSLTSVLLGQNVILTFLDFVQILQLRDTKLRLVCNFQQDDSTTNSYHIITTIHKFLHKSGDLKQPSEKSDSDIKRICHDKVLLGLHTENGHQNLFIWSTQGVNEMYLKCSTEKHSSAARPTFLKTLRKEVKSDDASIIN